MNGRLTVGLLRAGQLDLGLLGGFLEALQRHRVVADVDALGLLELVGEVVDERWSKSSPPRWPSPLVDFHLEDAVADVEDRDVERAAAEVEDGDLLVGLLVQAVGQAISPAAVGSLMMRLDLEAGDLAGVSLVAWRWESLK